MESSELERLRSASGLSMDVDGTFRHEGVVVEHPRVVAMLRRGLGRAPDGRPIVRFGETWGYLTAAGDLFRVTSVSLEPASAPPLNGTCVISMPVLALSSSLTMCGNEPLPNEA